MVHKREKKARKHLQALPENLNASRCNSRSSGRHSQAHVRVIVGFHRCCIVHVSAISSHRGYLAAVSEQENPGTECAIDCRVRQLYIATLMELVSSRRDNGINIYIEGQKMQFFCFIRSQRNRKTMFVRDQHLGFRKRSKAQRDERASRCFLQCCIKNDRKRGWRGNGSSFHIASISIIFLSTRFNPNAVGSQKFTPLPQLL
jgi:hypothetical protein